MLAAGEVNSGARPVRIRVAGGEAVSESRRQIDLTKLPQTPTAWRDGLKLSVAASSPGEEPVYRLGRPDQPISWPALQSGYGRSLLFLQLILDGEAEIWLETSADEAALRQNDWNDEEISQLYGHLTTLRQLVPALRHGQTRFPELDNQAVFVLARDASLGRCTLVLNLSQESEAVEVGNLGSWVAGTHELLGDGQAHPGGAVTLRPLEARLYEWRQGNGKP